MADDKTNSRFLQIIGVFLLVVLVALTVSLVLLQSKLNQVLTQMTPPTAVQPANSEAAMNPAQLVPAPEPAAAKLAMRTSPSPRRQTLPPATVTANIPPEPVLAVTAPAAVSAAPQPPLVLPASPRPIVAAPADVEPRSQPVTVPSGTVLTIRLINTLRSDQSRPGDRFTAVLDEPITSSSGVIAPRGSTVEGSVVASREAGRVTGLSELSLELDRLMLRDGRSLELVTDALTQQGEASRGKDAAKVGVGTAIGAAIGAIAGGRRGAGIGAATGAGAGTADVLLTRGKPVVLSAETRLSFRLRAPLHTEIRPGDALSDSAEWSPEASTTGNSEQGRPRLRRQ